MSYVNSHLKCHTPTANKFQNKHIRIAINKCLNSLPIQGIPYKNNTSVDTLFSQPYKMLRNFASYAAKTARVAKFEPKAKMQSWQIHEYGDVDALQLCNTRVPFISKPHEVLVKVEAASVNPIDNYMIGGYGRTMFQIPRCGDLELPLTVGRDFCGTVISKGHGVGENIQVGDEVYGFVPIHKQGSFAEAVLCDACHILQRPRHLSKAESASLVYATMTAWSALFVFGNLLLRQRDGLRVLILGASGGVGTSAVQLLKSQNCVVFGTCASDAVSLVYSLGADCVYNYNDPDYLRNVELEGRYHIILDCAKVGYQNIPASWKYDTFITLNSPLLVNTDKYGLVGGLVQSANDLLEANLSRFQEGSRVKWGFFIPSTEGFKLIDDLVTKEKLKPTVHKSFGFEQLPTALKTLAEGHIRGKIVIDYSTTE